MATKKIQPTNAGPRTVEALAAEIKKGIVGSFVFYGEEDYLKNHYRTLIYNAIMEEGMEAFNYFPISFSPAVMTKEEAISRLSDAALALPVMQDKKLIVISDLAPASLPKDLFESLCSILTQANESDDTVLVLYCRADEIEDDYKTESATFFKKLSASAKIVKFDLQPRGKLIAWIKKHFSNEIIRISDEAAEILAEMCAGRMTPLAFEIEKLICYAKYVNVGESLFIDEADVKKIAVAGSPDEVPFAMLNAAQGWKLADMLDVLMTAREQREEPVAVLARLSRIYLDMLMIKTAKDAAIPTGEIAKIMKMKEFRITKYLASIAKVPTEVLENAIRLSYETDKQLKSAPADPWVLLDLLAVRIYAPKSLRKG
jgi:DNA polymerase-3 subunit delta